MSTLSAPARSRSATAAETRSSLGTLASLGLSLATALVIMGLALLPLLTPAWIHLAMGVAGGQAAGVGQARSFALSDAVVSELLLGPGTFAITYDGGRSLLGPDEVAHMQNVRLVLWLFLGAAVAAAVLLAFALGQRGERARWRAVARGGAGLVVALLVAGAFAAVAFGIAFELFHRVLFPGGNWAFDPAQSNLVRMYPLGFWQLSAAAYGCLAIAGGTVVWLFARRRSRAPGGSR